MRLKSIKIQNFRKLNDVEINFGDATFLIGANNAGKSSTLDVIEYLVTDKKLDNACRSKYIGEDGEELVKTEDVIIEGCFDNVQASIVNQRGFNSSRLNSYTDEGGNEKYSFNYRVRLTSDGKNHREIQMHQQELKDEFVGCKKWQDYIDKGASTEIFSDVDDLNRNLTAKEKKELEDNYPSLFEVQENNEWFENPGGIAANVLSKLPRFLKIKADVLSEEMDAAKSGTLHDLLSYMFDDVRKNSEHYKKAAEELQKLSKEMDPNDENGAFGQLMSDLNKVVDDVFPKASINVDTDLTKAESLKPIFDVTMSSNVTTDVLHQGTGLVRSAVFALLRFNKQRTENIGSEADRGLIIGFEEPELFLHPNAAENMRRVIYELADSNSQIVATTHSPYMIDLSQKPKQVLNSYTIGTSDFANIIAFNLTDAFRKIQDDDKVRVKMIQKIDDYVARVFFAQKVIIVEGDTEDIVFKRTIEVMPDEVKKIVASKYQIIKATGKATMISFIKYLKALSVDLFVVHDEDAGTAGAVIMNVPILTALGNDPTKRLMMHNCVEDELGYSAPKSDKPFKAYKQVKDWQTWNDVPENWKNKMKIVFSEFADKL